MSASTPTTLITLAVASASTSSSSSSPTPIIDTVLASIDVASNDNLNEEGGHLYQSGLTTIPAGEQAGGERGANTIETKFQGGDGAGSGNDGRILDSAILTTPPTPQKDIVAIVAISIFSVIAACTLFLILVKLNFWVWNRRQVRKREEEMKQNLEAERAAAVEAAQIVEGVVGGDEKGEEKIDKKGDTEKKNEGDLRKERMLRMFN